MPCTHRRTRSPFFATARRSAGRGAGADDGFGAGLAAVVGGSCASGAEGPSAGVAASASRAGGAIAGIGIAFLSGVLEPVDAALASWSSAHNPFFQGSYANLLSLLPFAALAGLLYGTARKA